MCPAVSHFYYAEFEYQFLVSSHQILRGHSFVHLILKQSEAIKFARDWKCKGQEIGGKRYKNVFARNIYFVRSGRHPPSENASSEEKTLFKRFKRQHQRFVSSRNCLLEIYDKVSLNFVMYSILQYLPFSRYQTVRGICAFGFRLGR